MRMRDEPLATIISGTTSPIIYPVLDFLHQQRWERIDLIEVPGLERALIGTDERKRYLARDIAYTKASLSYNRGSRLCILVTEVFRESDQWQYRASEWLADHERSEVLGWEMFQQVHATCLAPDGKLYEV